MSEQFKIMLDESNIPKAWYNINVDMPVRLAVLHPINSRILRASDEPFPD